MGRPGRRRLEPDLAGRSRILEPDSDGPRIIVGTVELATQVGNRESSMIRVTEFQATDL